MKPSIRGWRIWGGHDHLDAEFPNPQIQEQRYGHWDTLLGRAQPFLNDKVLSNVGVHLGFMRTPFPTPPNPEGPSQHPKPRNTGRDRRIWGSERWLHHSQPPKSRNKRMDDVVCHQDCLSPFLDNGAIRDVGAEFGVTPPNPLKPGRPFPGAPTGEGGYVPSSAPSK